MDWGMLITTITTMILGIVAFIFSARWQKAKRLLVDICKAIEDDKIDTEEGQQILQDIKELIGD